jgi:replicative DNA helicase
VAHAAASAGSGSALDAHQCEAAILGAAMRYPAAAADVLGDLAADDLTDPAHRAVLDAVRQLLADDVPPDPALVIAQLHRTGHVRAPTDRPWRTVVFHLWAVTTATFPAAAPHYRRALLEARLRRDADVFAHQLHAAAARDPVDALWHALDTATQALGDTLARLAETYRPSRSVPPGRVA